MKYTKSNFDKLKCKVDDFEEQNRILEIQNQVLARRLSKPTREGIRQDAQAIIDEIDKINDGR